MKSSLLQFFIVLFVFGSAHLSFAQDFQLADKDATAETVSLYANMKKMAGANVMFGHQESDAYGVGWKGDKGRSDVKDICGDFPAVHGWDIGNEDQPTNVDDVAFSTVLTLIKDAYLRGGINTISWHVDNPVSGASAWDKNPVVADILPGGKGHEAYLRKLNIVADFLNRCETSQGKIPVIFRPFHEHNGDWFWWGKGICSESDFIALWKFTVKYLRDEKKLHHLIYAFSPDRSRIDLTKGKNEYLYAYPGDEYVDIIGLDDYMDVGVAWNKKSREEQNTELAQILRLISDIAEEKKKIAAVTETGLEGVTNSAWYTDVILNPLKNNPDIKISYLMVWRNANTTHHYVPYKGHAAEKNFVTFYNDPVTLFEKDIKGIYRKSME